MEFPHANRIPAPITVSKEALLAYISPTIREQQLSQHSQARNSFSNRDYWHNYPLTTPDTWITVGELSGCPDTRRPPATEPMGKK